MRISRKSWTIRARALRDESGITGLETAIVLIAFVVVASVFAFAVFKHRPPQFRKEQGDGTWWP